MNFLLLEEVDSTNSYVAVHAAELEDMTMVIADSQTAGRGQRGNSWESEQGKNLTFTLLYKPQGIAPREQFAISEAAALAVADFLVESGMEAKVKWPNDIYAGDRKISGILIEHALMGQTIQHTRIGIGLNVNQREFRSDAPNPVSMVQLLGSESDISRVAVGVGTHLDRRPRRPPCRIQTSALARRRRRASLPPPRHGRDLPGHHNRCVGRRTDRDS